MINFDTASAECDQVIAGREHHHVLLLLAFVVDEKLLKKQTAGTPHGDDVWFLISVMLTRDHDQPVLGDRHMHVVDRIAKLVRTSG